MRTVDTLVWCGVKNWSKIGQFVGEHFEQHYTGLNLANNWDFIVLKRSLRGEKSRKVCKIDSFGSNLYRVTSSTLYMAKCFKRFSYIRYVYSLLCYFAVHRSSNVEVRPYETVCVVFDKYIFKTQMAHLPPLPLLAKGRSGDRPSCPPSSGVSGSIW